jgi:hypothetical protein
MTESLSKDSIWNKRIVKEISSARFGMVPKELKNMTKHSNTFT